MTHAVLLPLSHVVYFGRPLQLLVLRCCRRMWALLQLHAKQCTVADCPVLRCRELRQMRRLQMARQEEKRRVAYKNMLRNQARRRQG